MISRFHFNHYIATLTAVVIGSILFQSESYAAKNSSKTKKIQSNAVHATEPKAPESKTYLIVALPESSIQLDGDSTMKKFSSKATQIQVRANVVSTDNASPFMEALSGKMKDFQMIVPVSGLKATDKKLDEHMLEALKGKEYPEIRAVLISYQEKAKSADGGLLLTAMVDFTIAGKTKSEQLEAVATLKENTLHLKGEKQLLMTDFGIDPPSMLLGTMKTKNEINVKFNFVLATQSNEGK